MYWDKIALCPTPKGQFNDLLGRMARLDGFRLPKDCRLESELNCLGQRRKAEGCHQGTDSWSFPPITLGLSVNKGRGNLEEYEDMKKPSYQPAWNACNSESRPQ